MTDTSADRDPLDRLAEEFVARYRAGERPGLEEFAQRLPNRADEVRDLFPALVEMEQLKPVTADRTGGYAPSAEFADPVRLGDFRIVRRVGTGGMGVVYEAVQESLGRHVALKLLPAEALLDPKKLERFRREAKSAAKLHHTNIVPVFGTGEADGRHFYAMQFIAGHPLDAVIDEVRRLKGQPVEPAAERPVSVVASALVTGSFVASPESDLTSLPSDAAGRPAAAGTGGVAHSSPSLSAGGSSFWTTVARIGIQVADALAYAHTQGIQHRDIKPANLLLDLKGMVWVTDFGLAKSADADDLTHTGDILGTLRYMAPERFDGHGDERADIYALGLTLYELLTLTPAFASDKRAKLIEQVLAANPPRPRAINGSIPRDLETVILKAIARDPAARYQTAAELRDDLQRYLEGRAISARRVSSVERAWRAAKRNPAVASLIAATVFLLIAGTTVSLAFAFQAEQREADARREAKRADDARTDAEVAGKQASDRAEEIARREAETQLLLYTSRMNLASAAAAEYRAGRLRELLEEARPKAGEPELRGWEWHYLNRLANPPATMATLDIASLPKPAKDPGEPGGFGGRWFEAIANAKFSADGRHLVALSQQNNAFGGFGGFGRGAGESRPGAAFDSASGKVLRVILPPAVPPLPSKLPIVSPSDFGLQVTVEPRDSVPLPDGVAGPTAPIPGYRLRATNTITSKETVPPIDFPPLPETKAGFRQCWVSVSEDANRVVVLSAIPPVAYIWRRETGKVETRPLAKPPEVEAGSTPWNLWVLTRDGSSAVGFVQKSKTDTNSPTASLVCTVEVHDLTGPVTPPTILADEVNLNQTALFSLHSARNSAGSVIPILDGEAGRTVRLLDTRKKQWVGRWAIPANIPLSWDTQLNGLVALSAGDDGRRVVLGNGNGLFLIGERVDPGGVDLRTTITGAETWRTSVLHPPVGAWGGMEPSWLSPDGKRFSLLELAANNTNIRTWDLTRLYGYGPTWPERVDVAGVSCYRVPALRTGDWDLYTRIAPVPGRPVEFGIAVRNRATGKVARQLTVEPPAEVRPANAPASLQVTGLSADGRRALVLFSAGDFGGGFGSPVPTTDGPKNVAQLLDLDRPERPVLRTFAHIPWMSRSGRWLVESIPANAPAKPPPVAQPGVPREEAPRFQVVSSETGEPVAALPKDFSVAFVPMFSRDDRVMLVESLPPGGEPRAAKTVTLTAYDVAAGRELWSWECPRRGRTSFGGGRPMDMNGEAFSPDGKTVAYRWQGERGETEVWLLDIATGKVTRELRCAALLKNGKAVPFRGGGMASLPATTFGPNGELVVYDFRDVIFWNGTAAEGTRLKGHEQTVIGGTFSPNGKRLFTVDANSQGIRTVHVWDTATAHELLAMREPTAAAKVHCNCEDVPINLRFEGQKLLMDAPGVSLVFDGTPLAEGK